MSRVKLRETKKRRTLIKEFYSFYLKMFSFCITKNSWFQKDSQIINHFQNHSIWDALIYDPLSWTNRYQNGNLLWWFFVKLESIGGTWYQNKKCMPDIFMSHSFQSPNSGACFICYRELLLLLIWYDIFRTSRRVTSMKEFSIV